MCLGIVSIMDTISTSDIKSIMYNLQNWYIIHLLPILYYTPKIYVKGDTGSCLCKYFGIQKVLPYSLQNI